MTAAPLAFWWDTHVGASSEVLVCPRCAAALGETEARNLTPANPQTVRLAEDLTPADVLTCFRCESAIDTQQEP